MEELYSSASKKYLLSICKEKHIKGFSNKSKEEIIERLLQELNQGILDHFDEENIVLKEGVFMSNIDKINKILKEVTNKKIKLNPKKNLFKQGLDSLDVTSFLLALEEKFNLKFKSDAYDKLTNIKDIAAYIEKNKKK